MLLPGYLLWFDYGTVSWPAIVGNLLRGVDSFLLSVIISLGV